MPGGERVEGIRNSGVGPSSTELARAMAIPVFPSDLSDAEWALLVPLLPSAKPGGRPRSVDLRRILNGLFYLVHSGCASVPGHSLPRDDGPCDPWSTVGLPRLPSVATGRPVGAAPAPTSGPGAPTGGTGASAERRHHRLSVGQDAAGRSGPRGLDGTKKVSGRKRHLLVDPLGLLCCSRWSSIPPTCMTDQVEAKRVLETSARPFRGSPATGPIKAMLVRCASGWPTVSGSSWTWSLPGGASSSATCPDLLDDLGVQSGFHVLPPLPASVVERTIAWLGRSRRLSKDYERLPASSVAIVCGIGLRLLLARLTRDAV